MKRKQHNNDEKRLRDYVLGIVTEFLTIEEVAIFDGRFLSVIFIDKLGDRHGLTATIYEESGKLRSDFEDHVSRTITAGLLLHVGNPDDLEVIQQ